MTIETSVERIDRVNESALGRSCDDLEFRLCNANLAAADIGFRDSGSWVTRVPVAHVSLEVLDAVATAVRCGKALGRAEGKREIGNFLREQCGL